MFEKKYLLNQLIKQLKIIFFTYNTAIIIIIKYIINNLKDKQDGKFMD